MKVAKKVVRVEHDSGKAAGEPTWKPSPQAKGFATQLRVVAFLLWAVCIGIEAFAIFWVLKQHSVNMVLLIGAIVAIAAFSIIGSLLWKRANQADPASRSEPIRFFIQNQLGAIIAIIAFLPLIVMILTNKNLQGQQKTIAGGVAIVALVISGLVGYSFNPPSTEQYTEEVKVVEGYTGHDLVYWTKEGSVYHLCEATSAVNLQSKDNTIYSGTVGDAHADGKERLTLQVDQELKQCGLTAPASPGN
jgi:hypothetical protein